MLFKFCNSAEWRLNRAKVRAKVRAKFFMLDILYNPVLNLKFNALYDIIFQVANLAIFYCLLH